MSEKVLTNPSTAAGLPRAHMRKVIFRKKRIEGDRVNRYFLKTVSLGVISMFALIVVLLLKQAWPLVEQGVWSFFTSDYWDPLNDEFGALAFFYGTIITAFGALLLATPVGLGTALFITEVLPEWWGKVLGIIVEMIAAIPSIVLGLWGIFYLAPWVRHSLSPQLKNLLGFLPFFQGPSFGMGILTACLILALMIIPTITSICREIFKTVPQIQKEGALSLGATRMEMIKLSILRPNLSGILSALVLALGRALGETMAVAMVIGNQAQIKASLFAPAATMSSVIANEYAEAESDLHVSALCLIGVVLFLITLFCNIFAKFIVRNQLEAAANK